MFLMGANVSQKDENPKENPLVPLKAGRSIETCIPMGEWRFFKIILTSAQREQFIASNGFCRFSVSSQNYLIDGSDVRTFVSLHDPPTQLQFARKFHLSGATSVCSYSNQFYMLTNIQIFDVSLTDVPTMSATSPLIVGLCADAATELPDCSALIDFEFCNENKETSTSIQSIEAPNGDITAPTRENEPNSTKFCANCNRFIPENNFIMHQNFCLRNNVACEVPGCGQVILKSQKEFHCHCEVCKKLFSSVEEVEKHTISFHVEKTCRMCGQFEAKLEELREHQENSCANRLIRCRFCEDIVYAGGDPDDIRDKYHWNLSKHESQCGSKTVECEICHSNIRLKELRFHMDMHNEIVTRSKVTQEVSNTASRTPDTKSTPDVNDEQLQCPICNEKVASMRLLNSHLDTKHS